MVDVPKLSRGLLSLIAGGLLIYGAYRLFKGDTPKQAARAIIDVPATVIEEVKETVTPIVADVVTTPIEHAGKTAKKILRHKGHKSKRGLALDQKLKSSQPHEKKYRRKKKSKRK